MVRAAEEKDPFPVAVADEEEELEQGVPRIIDTKQELDDETKKKLLFQKSFHLEYIDTDGKKWDGTFTCKRLTLGESSRVGVIHARLNGGENVSMAVGNLNFMLAYCAVALVETPSWWTPEEFYDAGLLQSVYDYVRAWENSFRKPMGK